MLIDSLIPREEEKQEALFTEDNRCIPAVEIGDYEKACIRAFMEIFPDSKLETQVLDGKTVTHNAVKLPVIPCERAKNAQKNLKSLSDWVVSHEKEICTVFFGREIPVGCAILHFSVWREDHTQTVPRMELWEQ